MRAAVIISDKKGSWIAGADIEQFRDFKTPADGERASREGQKLLEERRYGEACPKFEQAYKKAQKRGEIPPAEMPPERTGTRNR